ncbi:MAG: magnesium/cobalt transporter CorA [Bacteroidales bacterium]|nr:magnesium/cobalt transporter CorA [Bacteroidales bacterium]MDY0140969.1 magnesium/cobalt transporter CorA [Bacteroidales bacterium]
MKINLRNKSKTGLPPGSLIFSGHERNHEVKIEQIKYSAENFSESIVHTVDDIDVSDASNNVYWINLNGVHDPNVIKKIGEKFNIHKLVLEDILNTHQRPKVDFYNEHVYAVIKMLIYDTNTKSVDSEQVSVVMGPNHLISFQEKIGDVFEPLRNRIRNSAGKIRTLGTDYLLYAILDIIVDNYFLLLENLGEEVEKYEANLIENADKEILHRIYYLKRENLLLRNAVWPVRELVSRFEKTDSNLIKKKNIIYFRDLYDHTIQVIDNVEIYRDLLSGLIELYYTGTGNRTNEVMKVLTIIATIFIPLTFIAGIYGMNFKYMPELEWHYAYFVVWGLMIVLFILMMWYFKRRKWL